MSGIPRLQRRLTRVQRLDLLRPQHQSPAVRLDARRHLAVLRQRLGKQRLPARAISTVCLRPIWPPGRLISFLKKTWNMGAALCGLECRSNCTFTPEPFMRSTLGRHHAWHKLRGRIVCGSSQGLCDRERNLRK